MLRPLLAHALVSGRLVVVRCQPCVVALGLRYASQSHYDTLGVQRSASQAEIKSAFISLSKKLHPDMNQHDAKNHERFVKLNEAYTVLSKAITRREYDLTLARRVHLERQARNASSSHVYGSSRWPGTAYDRQYEAEQQVFWDETIFDMRDKSKDKEYEDRPYYPFTNMKRVPNSYIMMGCIAFMCVGALLQFLAFSTLHARYKASLDERDKRLHAHLAKLKEEARKNGNALQIEQYRARVEKRRAEKYGVPEQQVPLEREREVRMNDP